MSSSTLAPPRPAPPASTTPSKPSKMTAKEIGGLKRLAELAPKINASHDLAWGTLRTSMEQAIECGRLLAEAKALCSHGHWLPWLRANTTVSERTAQGWMLYAELPPAIVEKESTMRQALAAAATRRPDQIRDESRISARTLDGPAQVAREPIPQGATSRSAAPLPADGYVLTAVEDCAVRAVRGAIEIATGALDFAGPMKHGEYLARFERCSTALTDAQAEIAQLVGQTPTGA
jgi:hypothetical protein